jgi:hypothetical protein
MYQALSPILAITKPGLAELPSNSKFHKISNRNRKRTLTSACCLCHLEPIGVIPRTTHKRISVLPSSICQPNTNWSHFRRENLRWVNGPNRLGCRQTAGPYLWLMWKCPAHCVWFHTWTGCPGCYTKAGWASLREQASKQRCFMACSSVQGLHFPALMSFDDGLRCGSIKCNTLFPYSVTFSQGVLISATETLRPFSKKDDITDNKKISICQEGMACN